MPSRISRSAEITMSPEMRHTSVGSSLATNFGVDP